MSADRTVAAAKAEAQAARLRLVQSAQTLQARVAPSRIANDALESAKERGMSVLDRATDEAQRRPGVVAAVGLGLVAFLARRRIARLFRRKPKADAITIKAARHALPSPKGEKK